MHEKHLNRSTDFTSKMTAMNDVFLSFWFYFISTIHWTMEIYWIVPMDGKIHAVFYRYFKNKWKKTYVKSINKFIISDLLMSSSLRVALLGMHVWQTVIMALENCPKDSYNSAKKEFFYSGGGKTVENALFIVFFN